MDDKIEGKWDQSKGKIKEEAGKLGGDASTEWSGKGEQVRGSRHARDLARGRGPHMTELCVTGRDGYETDPRGRVGTDGAPR